MEDRLAELERRFARTEHRARLMFALGLLMVMSAAVLVAAKPAVTQTNGSTVKAPFQVVNDKGKVLMEVNRNGLTLFYGTGQIGVWLSAGDEGGRLQLHGNTFPNGMRLGGDAILETVGEGARLELLDTRGQLGASLAVAQRNRLFVLYDKDSNPVFRGGYGGMEPAKGTILP